MLNAAEIERATSLWAEVNNDYIDFKTQMGAWQAVFEATRPAPKAAALLQAEQKPI